jgi:hypothetical protein
MPVIPKKFQIIYSNSILVRIPTSRTPPTSFSLRRFVPTTHSAFTPASVPAFTSASGSKF